MKNSVRIPSEAVAKIPEIGPSAFCLYAYFAAIADKNGECDPSYDEIVQATGMAKQTISNSINILRGSGLILKHRRFNRSTSITLAGYASLKIRLASRLILHLLINNKRSIKRPASMIFRLADQRGNEPIIPDPEPQEPTPFQRLNDTFVTHAKIWGPMDINWREDIEDMVKAGVTPEILERAIKSLVSKKFTITSPRSVIKACGIEMQKASKIQIKTQVVDWANDWSTVD